MPYTVWSRGRLVGTSELAYARAFPDMRMGDFEPSPIGETLLPIILGVAPALRALHDVLDRTRATCGDSTDPLAFPAEVRRTTEYADVVSAQDELDALALELRDPPGNLVTTEWIWFQDTHRLLALAREEMAAIDPELVPEDEREPWEPEPPRYQIMVGLEGYEKRMDLEVRRLASRQARKARKK